MPNEGNEGNMDSKGFYQHSLEFYKIEVSETNAIYSFSAILLTAQTALGAAIVAVSSTKWIDSFSIRNPHVALYYLSVLMSFCALVIAFILFAKAIHLREYRAVKRPNALGKELGFFKEISNSESADNNQDRAMQSDVFRNKYDTLAKYLANAHEHNQITNEERRQWMSRSVKSMIASAGLLCIALVCRSLIVLYS